MKLRASVLACVTAFLPLQNAFAVEPGWPQSIAIATASPGGTYYVSTSVISRGMEVC